MEIDFTSAHPEMILPEPKKQKIDKKAFFARPQSCPARCSLLAASNRSQGFVAHKHIPQ